MNPEWLRYYFAAKLNARVEDIDFNPDDFVARVNSDLVGKYVNIASRARRLHRQALRRQAASRRWRGRRRQRCLATLRAPRADIGDAFEAREYRQGAARDHGRWPTASTQYVDRQQALGAGQGRAGARAELHDVCTRALITAFAV